MKLYIEYLLLFSDKQFENSALERVKERKSSFFWLKKETRKEKLKKLHTKSATLSE